MPEKKKLKVGEHTIELSNADKVLYPDDGVTKGDVVQYYLRIAETMIPYMRSRPLSMQRFPDGIHGFNFYQKEAPDYFPDWIERVSVEVKEEGGSQPQVVCQNAETLVYLANQACITPHTWLSRVDKLNHPDRLIFDLDPPHDGFEIVRDGAWAMRETLEEIGVTPFVMTTGSRGLHIVIPLDRSEDFDSVRDLARQVAEHVSRRDPERFTTEISKEKRRGRLFLDYLRNAYAQTAVTPYALRAKPGAPVATPIGWHELDDKGLSSQKYAIKNVFRRLGQRDDPWKGMIEHVRSPREIRSRLATSPARD